MTVASITLDRVYLHTAADQSDYAVYWSSSITGDDSWDAQRRTYTGGRHRLVTTDTAVFDVPVALKRLAVTDRDGLRARGGTLQLLRGPHGIKRYGFFDSRDVTELGVGPVCDVSLVFREISFSEAT